MSIKDKYRIREISHETAMEIIVEKHYLHRKSPCSFSFALMRNEDNKLMGVIIYGTPSSSPLRQGICGIEEKFNVIELTRLWIDDEVEKNGESFLVGNTLGLVNKEIVVSFADTAQNHLGIIYQATNWLYTGLSHKFKDLTVKGLDVHCHTLNDKYNYTELREKYGEENLYYKERSRKHRYVYFNASKRRKKELLNKLRYKILPYPKNQNYERNSITANI